MNLFSFSEKSLVSIEQILKKYPADRKRSAILPLLDLAQRECDGWLPVPALEEIGRLLDLPYIRVHEVASFYSMFNLKPVGTYHVQVCGTTPCWLRGAADIMETCKRHLGIQKDGTTADCLFTLSEVECLGACVNAPIVQINDDYYEDLSNESVVHLLNALKEKNVPTVGSQIGRQCSKAYDIKKAGA